MRAVPQQPKVLHYSPEEENSYLTRIIHPPALPRKRKLCPIRVHTPSELG